MRTSPPFSGKTGMSKTPIVLLFIFLSIGVWRTFVTGKIFYLYNFGYIGISVFIGVLSFTWLSRKKRDIGRRISMLLVGSYMLVYLGFIQHENMQIEGFFLYLFSGVFAGATLHYLIAKVVLPFFWGRAWCGWACWTAAVLDFLPWKQSTGRIRSLGLLRYFHFFSVLCAMLYLFCFHDFRFDSSNELLWLIWGTVLYYGIAIAVAVFLKDNRAFCKYLCPITVVLKLSVFSVSKIEINNNSCTQCGRCVEICPMDVDLLAYARENARVLSSECIYCLSCQNACPVHAIRTTNKLDCSCTERLVHK